MKPHRYTLEEAEQLARRDKRRLVVLTVGALLVGSAYFLAPSFTAGGGGSLRDPDLDAPRVVEVPLEPIPFETPEALADIRDATPEQRLVLDTEPFVAVFRHARRQMPQHLAQLGLAPLDAARRDTLLAAPGEHRLAPLLVRGQVVDVERRRREGGTRDDWFVTLRGGDGVIAHGIVAGPPTRPGAASDDDADAIRVGDHLRIDGLFYKLYRHEVAGEWLEGPLVLADRARASMAPIDAGLAREAPALDAVQDDLIDEVHPLDDAALWQLMARAKLLAAETDWESARVVDQATLRLVYEDGDTFRGAPFRFPVSRNMDAWIETAPENPLGLAKVMYGWMGNAMWRTPVGVVKWIGPFERPEVTEWEDASKARYVEARGWFLKNQIYAKQGGEPGRAPLFVLADIRPFVPEDDGVTAIVLWVVLGITVVVIAVIFFLLRADRKKSTELQDALVRRRRARRDKSRLAGATPS